MSEWVPVGSATFGDEEPMRARGPLKWNWFGSSAEMRKGRKPLWPLDWRKGTAFGVMGVVLFLLFASMVFAAFSDATGEVLAETSSFQLALSAWVTLALLALPPLLWVWAFYRQGTGAMRSRLLLRSDRPLRDVGLAVGVLVAIIAFEYAVTVLLEWAGVSTENPGVEGIAPHLTWPLVFGISASAAIGEELFFRGLIQGRFGVVPANIFFGAAHFGYGTPLQVIFPLLFGFVLSWMVLRTRSLVPAIVVHFLLDVFALSLTKWGVA